MIKSAHRLEQGAGSLHAPLFVASALLLSLSRRLVVLWRLLLLLLGSARNKSLGEALIRVPDTGCCLLPALLGLLCCRPLQQLLLVQHLRRQLALHLHKMLSATPLRTSPETCRQRSLHSKAERPSLLHACAYVFQNPAETQQSYSPHQRAQSLYS